MRGWLVPADVRAGVHDSRKREHAEVAVMVMRTSASVRSTVSFYRQAAWGGTRSPVRATSLPTSNRLR